MIKTSPAKKKGKNHLQLSYWASFLNRFKQLLQKTLQSKPFLPVPFMLVRLCLYCPVQDHGQGETIREHAAWGDLEGLPASLMFPALPQ